MNSINVVAKTSVVDNSTAYIWWKWRYVSKRKERSLVCLLTLDQTLMARRLRNRNQTEKNYRSGTGTKKTLFRRPLLVAHSAWCVPSGFSFGDEVNILWHPHVWCGSYGSCVEMRLVARGTLTLVYALWVRVSMRNQCLVTSLLWSMPYGSCIEMSSIALCTPTLAYALL
jgi:hypothetical protein